MCRNALPGQWRPGEPLPERPVRESDLVEMLETPAVVKKNGLDQEKHMDTECSTTTPFRSPFSTIQQIHDLLKRQKEASLGKPENKPKFEDARIAGENLQRRIDVRSNLRVICRWKLKAFFHRFRCVGEFPDKVSDESLNKALEARALDEPSIRTALEAFISIKGVRVPTASALLTAIRPEEFTIIDRQAYKALGVEFSDGIAEYLKYLRFCHREANRWGITLRDHDRAVWQYGVELASRGQQGKSKLQSGAEGDLMATRSSDKP
jgi:hypothetical protein